MSVHQMPSPRPLLARKGAAAPVGATPSPDAPGPEDAAVVDKGDEASLAAQLSLIGEEGTPGAGEPPPPASLLPFSLRARRPLPDDILGGDMTAAAAAQDASAAMQRPDEATLPAPAVPGPVGDETGKDGQDGKSGKDEAFGTGGMDRATALREAPVAATPAAVTSGAVPSTAKRRRAVPWLGIAAVAAAVALVVIGWAVYRIETPPEAESVAATSAPRKSAPQPATPARPLPAAVMPAAPGPGTSTEATLDPGSGPSGSSAGQAGTAQAAAESSARAPVTPGGAARPGADADEETPADETASVDVVRIDPDGSAVIAGRAAPRAELIVLDNGKPIGTVRADAFGEWVFIPDAPLPAGGHEFGLVVKSVQGRVVIPARDAGDASSGPAAAPSSAQGSTVDGADEKAVPTPPLAPLPPRKPGAKGASDADRTSRRGSGDSDFVVQLASVKTRGGAMREWRKLKRRFPELLSGMKLNLSEARLADRGVVVRVRTGPFPEKRKAVDFCARLAAARQECLVIRTGGSGAE
ncbi:MAG: SPOR domain-containing protein [Alphaproteobacteria bacterium]|nr:MAG: SPOR domain-containing protein [Alphaproteobacteria bacterium]